MQHKLITNLLKPGVTSPKKGFRIIALLLFFLISFISFAQRFPVTTNIQLIPPFSTNLEDYASAGTDKLFVTATFNDFSVPSFNVKLQFTLTNGNISLETNPNAVFPPINLIPGQTEQFSGLDLIDYFNYNNMIISGISLDRIIENGLPEGIYQFEVQVLDFNSGTPISNEAFSNATVILNDPPQITFPQCGSRILDIEPQNIAFQWLPLHLGSPNSAFSTEYDIILTEVPEGLNPEEAVRSGLPIFETTTNINNFLYDPASPLLENGKTYAYRVRARDSENLGLFKNDGFSDVCWFTFGFSTGGEIAISSPENNALVSGRSRLNFSWAAPDNLENGQPHHYEIKLVQIEEGENPELALESGDSYFERSFPETINSFGSSFTLPVELESETSYVWLVKAYSKDIEVAASEPFVINSAPKISSFIAGLHEVEIISLNNEDFNNLSGKGLLQLEENGTEYEVNFNGLKLISSAGRLVLSRGEIIYELPDEFPDISLTPEIDKNGTATFYPNKIRLNKNRLEINGMVEWPFHLPNKNGEPIFIRSDSIWVNYDAFKLNGSGRLSNQNRFELLQPFDFELNLNTESDFYITNNFYKQRFFGEVIMPENVVTASNAAVNYSFKNWNQLFYNQVDLRLENERISLTKETNISLLPKSAFLDFSFERSGGSLANEPEWVGLNFEQYEIQFGQNIDDEQLSLQKAFSQSFTQNTVPDQKGWITNGGLQFYLKSNFEANESSLSYFNTFLGNLRQILIDIENSEVSEGYFKGFVNIPVISSDERFFYTLPLTSDGFEVGYLDETLEERSFVFNRYGGENRVDVTILRAVFEENERLTLSVDLEIPYIGVLMSSVEDFRVYGDYHIGFGKRGGSLALNEHVEGEYDGYEIILDEVAASFSNRSYAFSYSATMPLGEEFNGDGGPPRINIHSVEAVGELPENTTASAVPIRPEIPAPKPNSGENETLKFDSLVVSATSAIADFNGYLIMTKNDPKWGTSLQGGVNGKLKIPTEVGLGANLILGDKGPTKYWYVDAYFVDETGLGIPIFNIFNLVAMEGRIYRHMSIDEEQPVKNNRPNLIINPDVEFGAGIYIQMIDPEGGQKFKIDAGAEVLVEKSGFNIAMKGDLSALNTQGRTPGAGAAIKKKIAKAAAEEAARKAASELVKNIDLEVPIGDLTFGIQANDQTAGVSFDAGQVNASFSGDLSSVPNMSVNAGFGSNDISLSGNANGESLLNLVNGSNSFELNIGGTQSGSLNFNFDQLSLESSFDRQLGSAGFDLAYEKKRVNLEGNTKEGTGRLELQYDESKRMLVEGDKAGKGAFEFEFDNYFVSFNANKSEGLANFNYQDDQNRFLSSLNTKEGSTALALDAQGKTLEVQASKSGSGLFRFSDENTFFNIEGNKETASGSAELIFNSDNRIFAGLNEQKTGSFELELEGTLLALQANPSQKSTFFRLENGQGSKLHSAFNQSNGKGKFVLAQGADSISTEIMVDSSRFTLAYQGNLIDASSQAAESKFLLSNGEHKIGLIVNKNTNFSSLEIQPNTNDRLFISADPDTNSGEIESKFGELEFAVSASTEAVTFTLSQSDLEIAANVSSSSNSSLKLEKEDFSLGFETSSSFNNTAFELQKGSMAISVSSENLVSINSGNTNLSLDASSFGNSIRLLEGNELKELPLNENGYGELQFESGEMEVGLIVSGSSADLTIGSNGTTFQITLGNNNQRSVSYMNNGQTFSLARESDSYQLSVNDYSVSYFSDNSLRFRHSNGNELSVSKDALGITYSNHTADLNLSEQVLTYNDGQKNVTLGSSGFQFNDGDHTLEINSDKTARLTKGSNELLVSTEGLSAVYGNYQVVLNSDKSFSATDGKNSIEANNQLLKLISGDKSASLNLTSGEPSLSLTSNETEVLFSKDQFSFAQADKQIQLGGASYLNFQLGKKKLNVAEGQISFEEGEQLLAYGGENFVEVRDGSNSLKVTEEKSLVLSDGSKVIQLNRDRSAEFQEGEQRLKLGGEDEFIAFTDGSVSLGVNISGREQYGIEVSHSGNTLGLSTKKFKEATLSIESPYVNLSLTGDASKNISSSLSKEQYNVTLKGGKQGASIEGIESLISAEQLATINGVGGEAEIEYGEDVQRVEMQGPLYIGSITEDADGRIKGNAEFSYNSSESHFIANGAVSSTVPPCLGAWVAIDAKPGDWSLDIGNRERKIWVKPLCTGFEGSGWLHLSDSDFGLGVNFKWGGAGSAKVGDDKIGARINAEASASLGFEIEARIKPRFALQQAGIWANARASLGVEYWAPLIRGEITLFRAELDGRLTAYFENRTRITGELSGEIEIVKVIKADFETKFDKTF
ncbi:MAG: hypothetical protein AAF363_04150 [Bacteroidota bacterium]